MAENLSKSSVGSSEIETKKVPKEKQEAPKEKQENRRNRPRRKRKESSVVSRGDIERSFLQLLNAKRSRGFLTLIRNTINLDPIKNFSYSTSPIFLHYQASADGELVNPLIYSVHSDLMAPGNSNLEMIGQVDQSSLELWNSIAGKYTQISRSIQNIEGINAEQIIQFFNDLGKLLGLNRLVVLCEVRNAPDNLTFESMGLKSPMVSELEKRLHPAIGIVFSGIPENFQFTYNFKQFLDVTPGEDWVVETLEKLTDPLSNDEAKGSDTLKVESEVYALADTIALADMHPPLVVGIMGGWGSGKSFALKLIEDRLIAIRSEDISSEEKRKVYPYIGHPYIIQFNAWTYAKSSLWSSLMQEILLQFNHQLKLESIIKESNEGNALKGFDKWDLLYRSNPEELKLIAQNEDLGEDIIGAIKNSSEKTDVLWQALNELNKDDKDELESTEKELLESKKDLQHVLDDNDRTARKKSNESIHQAALDAASFSGMLLNSYKEAVKNNNEHFEIDTSRVSKSISFWKKLIMGFKPIYWVIPALAAIAYFLLPIDDLIDRNSMTNVGGPSLILISSLLTSFVRATQWISASTSKLNALISERKALREDHIENNKEIGLKNNERYKQLTEQITKWESNVEHLRNRIGITARHTSLVDFIERRLEQGDYAKRLGLMHQVHDDLNSLSVGINSHYAMKKGEEDYLFDRGRPRIILVIDDLDRCPPDRVVEVLEAAQLLVKTDLFVVVIAMDIKYVTKALEKKYEGVLSSKGDPTGLDYIEKIVQIPYRVRPISEDAMPDFLGTQLNLKPDGADSNDNEDNKKKGVKYAEISTPLPSDLNEKLSLELMYFEQEDINILNECALEASLGPRSTKRLANVLKLLKIIWYRAQMDEPNPDCKKIIVLILCLSAKFPLIMREALNDMEKHLKSESIKEFWTKMKLAEIPFEHLKFLERDWSIMNTILTKFDTKWSLSEMKKPIDLYNLQLVRSFSFVGELTSDHSVSANGHHAGS